MRRSSRTFVVTAVVVALAAAGPAAWAFWTASGGGTASAAASTLAAPGTPNASAATGASTVHVTWAAVTAPGGGAVDGYHVQRFAGAVASAACASSPSSLLSAATCNDLAVADGTYTYRVTAVFRTWTATSAASGAVVVAVDTVLPTATITFPADNSTNSSSAFGAGCTPVGICGAAADNASGVASVKVSVRQGTGNWWGGTAFDQATEVFTPATLATPGGLTTAWTYALAQPADGTYTVHVQAADAAGNAQTGAVYAASSTFTVDAAGPTVTLTTVNGSAVTFPFSTNAASLASVGGACGTAAGDSATVAVAITGAGTQSGTAPCTAGAWTYTVSPALTAQGTYSAVATQTDGSANTGSSGVKSITLDSAGPAVTLTSVNGSVVTFPFTTNAASLASVGGACGTAAGDSATVAVAITGAGTQSGTAPCTAGAWTYTVSPALTAQGTYSATATQTDGSANTGSSGAKSITLDSAGPAVTLTSVNGAVVTFPFKTNAASLTSLGGACGTAAGDSPTVDVAITGAGTQSGTAPCTAGAWTYTVSPALTAVGSYSATATQVDGSANTGSSGAKSILVDRTAPAVTLALAAAPVSSFLDGSVLRYNGNVAGSFRLVATVTDAGAGPFSATFPVQSTSGWTHGAETVSTPAGGPFTSANFTFANNAANPATYTVTVTDGAGNTATSAITFDDDGNDPSGSITAPADNAFVSGAVSVTATASDTGGAGVASTQFQVATNGGSTWTNIGAADTTSPYSVSWVSTGVTDGAYDLRVVTTDRVGRTDISGIVNVDVQNTAPTPTAVVLQRNGGTAGRVEQGDQVIVTYSQPLKVNSLYSLWSASGDRSDQSIVTNGVVSVAVTDGGAGNDTLTVTTSTGTFQFGTVNLGAVGYATGGSMAFGGTTNGTRSSVAWDFSSRTLTITLGAKTGTGTQGTVASSVAVYTPNAAITNAALVPITGTFTTGSGAKF